MKMHGEMTEEIENMTGDMHTSSASLSLFSFVVWLLCGGCVVVAACLTSCLPAACCPATAMLAAIFPIPAKYQTSVLASPAHASFSIVSSLFCIGVMVSVSGQCQVGVASAPVYHLCALHLSSTLRVRHLSERTIT
jgi:hypothetical protein